MKNAIVFLVLLYAGSCLGQPGPATVKEYQKIFTTYPFSDPNPIPLIGPVYPYFRFDGFTNKAVQKEWKVVALENDYIRLLILPEIGGKIWTAIEKSTNRPFIYDNHTVKFRDIAMRGPWTSGGLEANFGIIGHTPNCSTPVDYTTSVNADGSVSCTIGALDLLSRSNWRMEINLPKDKAYFTTRVFWYNASPQEEPYYHWMNAGLKAKGNLEFIFPGTRYLGHEGEFSDWPVNKTNGKKISFYEENNFGGYKSYHVFGKYTDFSGAYWHDDELGMVRFAEHDEKAGKKLWIWGLSGQGMIWEKLLTDSDGQYIELQSGRRFNQNAEGSSLTPFKQTAFAPYGTDTWKEYWYPVLQTKGFVDATEYGALNVKVENGWVKVYFSPVQASTDTLEIREGDRIIYSKRVQLNILKLFADSVKASAKPGDLVVQFGKNKFNYHADPAEGLLSRPVETPKNFDWNAAYGLTLLGTDAMEGKAFSQAEAQLAEALQKDPNFLPALAKMTALLYRDMRYTEALDFAKRALSINTYDGAANYYYGLINRKLQKISDAKDGFDIASLSTEYRSAALTQLAAIYFCEGNPGKAIEYATKALDNNRYDIEALQIIAVSHRFLGNSASASQTLSVLAAFDPLSHFVDFENYLSDPSEKSKAYFLSRIRNELPHETLMELGIWYDNMNRPAEAQAVFSLGGHAIESEYWLAFLQRRQVQIRPGDALLSFPFRQETATVLQELLKKQDDWLLKYHLALIYKDKNRVKECKTLLHSCGTQPDFAPFYAVRAVIDTGRADQRPVDDLKKALSLDRQWRYYKLLTEYYNNHGQYDSALQLAGPFYASHKDQYIMGMLYAKTLLLNKKYKEADAVLTKLDIIPFEGATDGRELFREAKLMQAVEKLQQKKYTAARAFVEQARHWPANLGVGKPYEEDIDVRLEDWISYLCASQLREKDSSVALLKTILRFSPHVENTVRNFIPGNALVTVWAYDKLGEHDKGINWLNEEIHRYPANKKLLWSKDALEKNQQNRLKESEKDANIRILERLMK